VQYYAKFDMAGWHMIQRSGVTRERLEADSLGFVDVRVEIDFVGEMVVNDPLVIESGVEKLGNSSLTFRSTMRHATTGAVTSRLRCTTLCFDLVERVKKTIPDDIRARLEPLVIGDD
ncbi:MAG: thioesterase family protein, partial [bacterium]|nr:thioesterase family protein [bacterium]